MADAPEQPTTITVPEISQRLRVCEETVYELLKKHEIPNLRHGHRFIVSRAAYLHWEATIGVLGVVDIHQNTDPACAERLHAQREAEDLKDLLNPEK